MSSDLRYFFSGHPVCYLRTSSVSFSLAIRDSDSGLLSRLFFLPPLHYGARLFCSEKKPALDSLVDSHRIANRTLHCTVIAYRML